MKPNMLFFTKENFDNSKIVPGNFIYVFDSDTLNRTLGFQMKDKTVRWIPLQQESPNTGGTSSGSTNSGSTTSGETNSSAPTTSETEVTENGSENNENPV